MVKIRLSRVGKKNKPSYKIVVCNAREKRESYFLDQIGWYSPITKDFNVDQTKVQYWLSVGAQPTDTVYALLVKSKIIEGDRNNTRLFKDKPKKKALSRGNS